MTVGRSHKQARLGAVLALVLGAGCVSPRSELRVDPQPVQTVVGTFRLEYPPSEVQGVDMVRASIEKAAPQLEKWGHLQQPVTVRIHGNHKALEEAAKHSGYAWLRAWTRYDVLDVQAPETWSPVPASQTDLDETMLHELTHALMFQAAASPGDWRKKKIPAWFREGMATYTANQGYRWPTLEQLTRTMEEHPKWKPLEQPEALYQNEMPIAYGAAHHAFTFLVNRYGEGAVRALLEQMRQGPDFTEAFQKAVGISSDAFLQDFERYLRLRGFRGGRLLHPAEQPPEEPAPESAVPTR